MYHYVVKEVHTIAIPLTVDPVGLDVIMSATAFARKIAEDRHIDLEDFMNASMCVEEWPDDGNPEHLVLRLVRDADRISDR